jgi:hypothetical protein
MHAEENKRRTVQKSDISTAVAKNDMYDFLIDIIPRDDKPFTPKTPKADKNVAVEVQETGVYENPYAYTYQTMDPEAVMYTPGYVTEGYGMQAGYSGGLQYEGVEDEVRHV